MQDSINKTPLANAADYRHEPESDQLLPDNYQGGEVDTESAGIPKLEIFSSSAGILNSVKINGIHHGVKHLGSGYYEVPLGGDEFTYLVYKDNKLAFAEDVLHLTLRRRSIELENQMRKAREKHVEA